MYFTIIVVTKLKMRQVYLKVLRKYNSKGMYRIRHVLLRAFKDKIIIMFFILFALSKMTVTVKGPNYYYISMGKIIFKQAKLRMIDFPQFLSWTHIVNKKYTSILYPK